MILPQKITSLNQTSKSSLGNENITLFLKLTLGNFGQIIIPLVLKRSKSAIGALVFDSVDMFAADYLFALYTA